ncbi:MAG: flagellar basal body-associated FliL family protein [Rhodobacteraceae bacterium]|nr:flagellar basal body-associated FliL family protein [Paracoccaceae bacterium]
MVLAVILSLTAMAGGLVLSMGPDKVLSMIVGSGEEETGEESEVESKHAETEMEPEHETADATLVVSPLKEMIVNIVSITETGRKSSRFLKLNLALVYDEKIEGASHVAEREVYIRDAFQHYLRQLTERDLSGSIGVVRLKSELLRRARAVTESDAPQEVLIADIIVQ